MGKLRHITISVPDPRTTVEIDKSACALRAIGATDSSRAGWTGLGT
jgi:hypothetical protein